MTGKSNCETCFRYTYDEELDCFVCDMDLDEDEMVRFLSGTFSACPYYQRGDDYTLARRQ
ncbi:MAG: DUF6472 family protein [Oscillospiraceae bacterium]